MPLVRARGYLFRNPHLRPKALCLLAPSRGGPFRATCAQHGVARTTATQSRCGSHVEPWPAPSSRLASSSTRNPPDASAGAASSCSAAALASSFTFVVTARIRATCFGSASVERQLISVRSPITSHKSPVTSHHLRLDAVVVVLYEPQNPINIAATIRAMKNMGVSRLRLVRPVEYDPYRLEGIAHGTHDLIDRIERYESFDE